MVIFLTFQSTALPFRLDTSRPYPYYFHVLTRGVYMFGIGMQEILVLLVIALVVIGPKKLPEMAKALGKGYGEFRRAFEDMLSSINVDMKTEEEKERLREIQSRVEPPPESETPKDGASEPSSPQSIDEETEGGGD
jgi:Tat protein translocase TatB subunit